MARVKVVNRGQNQDLIGGNFLNTASETVFSLGRFSVESNFTGRVTRDYGNELSSFVTPVTLETLGVTEEESQSLFTTLNTVELNLDRSDLSTFAKFGSASEILRVSIRNIVDKYPASLYADNQVELGGNITYTNFSYSDLSNESSFTVPSAFLRNNFGLVFNGGNNANPNDNELRNLNTSFERYVIWRSDIPEDNSHRIIGFTGDTEGIPFVRIRCVGNPFSGITTTTGNTTFHLKPQILDYNKFLDNLNELETYILANRRIDHSGYDITLQNPTIGPNGNITFTPINITWRTSDGYNIDINGATFNTFSDSLINLGSKYDEVKSDLVARLLTPASLKIYDQTDEQKLQKLLKIYGREFDEIKRFIDSLVYINNTSYDKKENIPDILVKNLARTFGWDVFNLVEETDIVNAFFSNEQEQGEDVLLPAEIDIELWRRILINTNYYWKSKGTRHAIRSIFRLIGIPEPFINITEYVYTVDGVIDPNTVELSLEDLPSSSLPYDNNGYPIAPREDDDFFFQLSGNSDSGQAYIDVYRSLGFRVNRVVDNKKSWTQEGFIERVHPSTPNYFQQDSRLLINTKEVDVTLDLARAIEYDVYCYNIDVDDPLTSTAITRPYLYVNVPFDYGVSANTFTIPEIPLSGSAIQLNFNGITLTSGGTGAGDYTRVSTTGVTLNDQVAQTYSNGEKDIITLTYLHDRLGSTGFTQVNYLVTAPVVGAGGTELDLGVEPDGDIQLIVNGISLTKGTSLFTGDFIVNPNDRTKIIIQNTELQLYLQSNPVVRVWYIVDDGTSTTEKRSEAHRVDSFSTGKFFFDAPNYVYTMNYTAFDDESIKVTLNGITLQNGRDFFLNPSNQKQIKFKVNVEVKLGDVIGVYYIIGESETPPLLPPDPTFPDLQEMSFLEYLELIQRRLINVRNRKTISNFNGGYYPTVLQLYEEYVRRSFLPDSDPLQSNGYTFDNLYPFINQYNAFFTRFVNQLLPATIIQKKSGILIRNTSFTRQKFMYRRGVNFNESLNYIGDDGALYKKTLPSGLCIWRDDDVCVDIQPTATTTTTTTTSQTIAITDSRINVSSFVGSSVDGGFGLNGIDIWNQVQANVGDVVVNNSIFRVDNNGSTITNNGDGTFNIDLDITSTFQYTSGVGTGDFFLPRVEIDFDNVITNATGLISSFMPSGASKNVVLYTQGRLVAEFNDIEFLTGSSAVTRNILGTVVIDTNGTGVTKIINVLPSGASQAGSLAESDFAIVQNEESPLIASVRNIGGNRTDSQSIEVFNITGLTEDRTYNITSVNDITFGHAILAEDTLTPSYFVDNNNKNGLVQQVSTAALTNTYRVFGENNTTVGQIWTGNFDIVGAPNPSVTTSFPANDIADEFTIDSQTIPSSVSCTVLKVTDGGVVSPNQGIFINYLLNGISQFTDILFEGSIGSSSYTYTGVNQGDTLSVEIEIETIP